MPTVLGRHDFTFHLDWCCPLVSEPRTSPLAFACRFPGIVTCGIHWSTIRSGEPDAPESACGDPSLARRARITSGPHLNELAAIETIRPLSLLLSHYRVRLIQMLSLPGSWGGRTNRHSQSAELFAPAVTVPAVLRGNHNGHS